VTGRGIAVAGEVGGFNPAREEQLVDQVEPEVVASLPPPAPRLGRSAAGNAAGEIVGGHHWECLGERGLVGERQGRPRVKPGVTVIRWNVGALDA